jgi:hypothetical protein
VAVVELHVPDDQVLIGCLEARERGAVPILEVVCDRVVERRRRGVVECEGRRCMRPAPREPAVLVADAIADRFAQVRGERSGTGKIDLAEARDGSRQRVLHDVGGVGHRAHPARQPSVGDAMKPGKVAGDELAERAGIAAPGEGEEAPGTAPRRLRRTASRRLSLRRHGQRGDFVPMILCVATTYM